VTSISRNNANRDGYVLVLTLGLIALAAVASAGLARHSLRMATSAQQAADDLQHRWGLLSVRHVLLDRAPEILESQVPDHEVSMPPWPKPARIEASFLLGNQGFTITLADEDAKVDLNTVRKREPARFYSVIRQLCRETDVAALNIRALSERGILTSFSSWGQVFDLVSGPAASAPIAVLLRPISREMTCWGTGRLNLRRASDNAVREVAGLTLSAKDVGEFVEARKHWGGQGLDELLDELDLRRPEYLKVQRLLSTESRVYSLWVEVDNGQRERSYFYVDNGQPICFAW
jgi:hypothetical protein